MGAEKDFMASVDCYDGATGHRVRVGFGNDGKRKELDLGPDEWMGLKLLGPWRWAIKRFKRIGKDI